MFKCFPLQQQQVSRVEKCSGGCFLQQLFPRRSRNCQSPICQTNIRQLQTKEDSSQDISLRLEKFHRGILCPHREMQQSSLCVQMFYSIWNNIVQYTWMLDTCYIQEKPLLTDAIHCQSVFTSKAARRSPVFTYVTRHCPLERRTCEGPTSLSSPPPPSSPRGH